MRDLLEELEAALQSQSPPLTAAFAKPASKEAIRKAERKLDTKFPDDLRNFLLCANGQRIDKHGDPIGDFIVPRVRFAPGAWGLTGWGHFLPLREIVQITGYHYQDESESDKYGYDRDKYRTFFGPTRSHYKHIIITRSEDPACLALDLHPARGGRIGQVVSIQDQPDYTAVVASSLSAFLRRLVDGYRQGRFHKERHGTYAEKGKA